MTQPDMLVQVRTVQSLEIAMLTPGIKWGKICGWHVLGKKQVWSLTQLYSIDFSQSRFRVIKVRFQQAHNQGLRQLFFTASWDLLPKRSYIWQCPLYICRFASNARGKPRVLSQLKKPFKSRDGDEGVAGRNGIEKSFSDEWCPPGKWMTCRRRKH